MDASTLEVLTTLRDLLVETKSKAISGVPDAQTPFGANGFFSNFGLDNVVVNASMSPQGIDRFLPVFPTVELAPIYPFITGFEGDGAAEPAGPCDDAPGGVIETCHQTAQFGRYTRSSKEMEANELMKIINGKLTTDLRVMGSILGQGHQLLFNSGLDQATFVNSVVQTQLAIIAVLLQRILQAQAWQGNPANNNAGGGYLEFPGLDILISTGKVDAYTGTTCPALDSDIKDFNYEDVDSVNRDIVEYVSMMEFYLRHNASRMGLLPTDWIIAMRPELWFELSAVWPCRYLSHRCGDAAGAQLAVINDNGNVAMRDEMRNGNFLWVNGRRYTVVTDDGIFEDTPTTAAELNPGEFSSDIYFVPLRSRNMPVCYWEHMDYAGVMSEVAFLQNRQRFWTSDSGRYLWAMQDQNYCFKFQGKIEPRLVLRTPQLAGRIQNVKYSPLQHLRSPFEDSPYFYKGGREDYPTAPSFFSEWNAP